MGVSALFAGCLGGLLMEFDVRNELDLFELLENKYLKNFEQNWANFSKTEQNWANFNKLSTIKRLWPKLSKAEQNWVKLSNFKPNLNKIDQTEIK